MLQKCRVRTINTKCDTIRDKCDTIRDKCDTIRAKCAIIRAKCDTIRAKCAVISKNTWIQEGFGGPKRTDIGFRIAQLHAEPA